MNNKLIFAFAAGSLLLTGCSNDLEYTSVPSTGMLRASVEGSHSSTRAGFDETGAFYWSAGDKLGVTTANNANAFSALSLNAEDAGQATGSFSGSITGEIGEYAVYPYAEGHSMSGSTLTYNFPASYEYSKVDADFFSAAKGQGNSFNPAMWGKIENGGVQLKHLSGVVCIKIEQMPVAAGTLTLVTDKKITGNFTVDLNGETPALAVPAEAAAADATDNTVTITFSNATVGNTGVFYVPVPTGTYDVRIKVAESSTEKINVAAGTYAIARCDLKKVELKNVSIEGGVTESQDLSAAQTSLGSSDAVSVSGEISSTSNEVSVPAVTSTSGDTQTTVKSLSLEKVASGASLKVSDANTDNDANKSVDKFILSIPNNETEGHKPLNVEIAMPNTTVTLAGNGGAASYGKVTASTADNTLVVESGVSVAEISVKKGNIRVKKGANVVKFTKDSSFTGTGKIIIYVETDVIIPASSYDSSAFEVVTDDTADLKDVLANGGYCSLSNDITGDFVVSAKSPVTINLNGHSITNKSGDTFTVNCGSSLTIQGEGVVDNVSHQKACIYNNGTVVLNGGTYTRSKENGKSDSDAGGNSYYNILNHGQMTINKGVTVSQNGKFSSMIANGYYTYSSSDPRSGYVNGTNNSAPSLVINDGEFQGGLNTIKNDDGATLEINGGNFMNFSQTAILNHNTATINGGVLSGTVAEYVIYNRGHNNEPNDLGDLIINGGNILGKIKNDGSGADLTINKGNFTDPNALHYLADKAQVLVSMLKDTSMGGFIIKDGQEVSLSLGGHTLTLVDPTVGSAGTETNSCQLLKGSKVHISTGTLVSDNSNIVIQNYSDLGLEGLTINTPNANYSVSNNNGRCVIRNTTINASKDSNKYAFDVYSFNNYEGVEVTVLEGSTINGNVEFGGNNNKKNGKLIIGGGTINGNLKVDTNYYDSQNPNITISDKAVFGEGSTGWDEYKK